MIGKIPGLKFEKAGHVYKYKGQQVLSVTQHLDAANLSTLGDIPWSIRDFALLRGQLVHEACALWDEGRLNMGTLDPILLPYVQAWIKLHDMLDAITHEVEGRVLGRQGRWAGTYDWRGSIAGFPRVILDRKCGDGFCPSARWQLAGYQEPVEKETGEEWVRGVALLRPSGEPKLCTFPEEGWHDRTKVRRADEQDLGVFLAAVSVNEARQHHLGRTGLEGRDATGGVTTDGDQG